MSESWVAFRIADDPEIMAAFFFDRPAMAPVVRGASASLAIPKRSCVILLAITDSLLAPHELIDARMETVTHCGDRLLALRRVVRVAKCMSLDGILI